MSDLTCEEAELYISLSPDGELSPEEQASLDCHVAACPRCRRSLENVTSLEWLVRTSLRTPDDTLTSNVRAAVRADARQRRQSRLVRRASAAAAALLIAVGLAVAGHSVLRGSRTDGNATMPTEAEASLGIIKPTASDPNEKRSSDDLDEEVSYSRDPQDGMAAIAGGDTGTASAGTASAVPWQTVLGILLAAVGAVCLALLI